MSPVDIMQAATLWPKISDQIFVPHTEQEYQQLVRFLDQLIDEIGENETHPLASLMEIIGVLIERYEDEHVPELSQDSI